MSVVTAHVSSRRDPIAQFMNTRTSSALSTNTGLSLAACCCFFPSFLPASNAVTTVSLIFLPLISVLPNSVESQIPSILTHSGSDTVASSPPSPPVLLTTSHNQNHQNHHHQHHHLHHRHNLHQRHHSTPLPMSLPMSLAAASESQDGRETSAAAVASYRGYQHSGTPPPSGDVSPNRMLSRLFSRSFFDDFQTALSQYDNVPTGSSDLLTVAAAAGHDRRSMTPHHSYLPSMMQQHQQQHHQHHPHHHPHQPRAGHVSRSNSSSVGSVRSMALVPTRTPSPLDFRNMSFRRPRSLASEESSGKQSATRTDSGYEKY